MTAKMNINGNGLTPEVSDETKKRWHKMEQLERAEDNIDIWTAKLETSKKYLKKWKAKAERLKKELESEGAL